MSRRDQPVAIGVANPIAVGAVDPPTVDVGAPVTVAAPRPVSDSVPRVVQISAAWSWRLLLIAAATAGSLWLLGVLKTIVVPVAIALLVAVLLSPVATWLRPEFPSRPDTLRVKLHLSPVISFFTRTGPP